MSLFFGTDRENRDEGNDITCEDYSKGNALYAFDLGPFLAEGHFILARQGTVRVELKFAAVLPKLWPLSPTEFENVIEIDRNRNDIYDFGR